MSAAADPFPGLTHARRMLTDPTYRTAVFAEWRRQEREQRRTALRRERQRWHVRPSRRRRPAVLHPLSRTTPAAGLAAPAPEE